MKARCCWRNRRPDAPSRPTLPPVRRQALEASLASRREWLSAWGEYASITLPSWTTIRWTAAFTPFSAAGRATEPRHVSCRPTAGLDRPGSAGDPHRDPSTAASAPRGARRKPAPLPYPSALLPRAHPAGMADAPPGAAPSLPPWPWPWPVCNGHRRPPPHRGGACSFPRRTCRTHISKTGRACAARALRHAGSLRGFPRIADPSFSPCSQSPNTGLGVFREADARLAAGSEAWRRPDLGPRCFKATARPRRTCASNGHDVPTPPPVIEPAPAPRGFLSRPRPGPGRRRSLRACRVAGDGRTDRDQRGGQRGSRLDLPARFQPSSRDLGVWNERGPNRPGRR